MKNISRFFAAFTGIVLLALAGCAADLQEKETESAVIAATSDESLESVISFAIGSSSRSALPAVSINALRSISIYYGDTSDEFPMENSIGNWTSYDELKNASVAFKVGSYKFAVLAATDSAVYGAAEDFTIKKGSNKLNFTLIPLLTSTAAYREGYGTLNVRLSFPTDNVKVVTGGLYTLEEAKVSGYADEELTIAAGGKVTYEKEKVPAGDYILVFKFYADDEKTQLLGTYREYAALFAGATSASSPVLDSLSSLFTITYERNGGTWATDFIAQGSYTRLSPAIFLPEEDKVSKAAAVFGGWYDNKECTGVPVTSIPAGSTGNKTFYAKWIDTVSVRFLPNGGSFGDGSIIKTQEITKNNNVALYTASSTNLLLTNGQRAFLGWVKNPASTEADYTDGQNVTLEKDLVLYALWAVATINPQSGDKTDTDKDGISDWDELYKYHTDPSNPDTDGDGWSDKDELNMYTTGSNTFNPLIADLPKLDVQFVGNPEIGFKYTTSTSDTVSENLTQSEGTVHSSSETNTNTNTHSETHGWNVGVKFGANTGFNGLAPVASASFEISAGYNGSVSNGDSYTYSKNQSESFSKSISNSHTTSETVGKTVTGGGLKFKVKFKNPSNIAYTVNSATITVTALSDYTNTSGTLSPVATIPVKEPFTLAPGASSGEIVLATDLSVSKTEKLLKYSTGIHMEISGYTIAISKEGQWSNDFTGALTTTMAQTAELNIDYGPSAGIAAEKHYVAVKNKYNTIASTLDAMYNPTSIKEMLETVQIVEGKNLVLGTGVYKGLIKSIRGVSYISPQKGAWFVLHTHTRNNETKTDIYRYRDTTSADKDCDISKIYVQAGDRVTICYNIDKDDDGVPYNEELLYGTSDDLVDTDGDGLTDYEEIYGWNPSEKLSDADKNANITESHTLVSTTVYTNPLIKDTDGDDIPDNKDPSPVIPKLKNDTSLSVCQYKTSQNGTFVNFGITDQKSIYASAEKYTIGTELTDVVYFKLTPKTSFATVKYRLSTSSKWDDITENTAIKLKFGLNNIYIQITAADGKTTKEHTIKILSTFASLYNLKLGSTANDTATITYASNKYTDGRITASDGGIMLYVSRSAWTYKDFSASEFKTALAGAYTPDANKTGNSNDFWIKFSGKEYGSAFANGVFTVNGMKPQTTYRICAFAYSDSGEYNRCINRDTITTAKSSKAKLTFYAHYVENAASKDGGYSPEYYWRCSSSDNQISFGDCTQTSEQKFRVGKDDFYCFGKKEMHRDNRPSVGDSPCTKKFVGTYDRSSNHSIHLSCHLYEWDHSSDDDLGTINMYLTYNKNTDKWTVAWNNHNINNESHDVGWGSGISEYCFKTSTSDGDVNVFFGVRWWEE